MLEASGIFMPTNPLSLPRYHQSSWRSLANMVVPSAAQPNRSIANRMQVC